MAVAGRLLVIILQSVKVLSEIIELQSHILETAPVKHPSNTEESISRTNSNPRGLSGESVQPSDVQMTVFGFWASRYATNWSREMSKRYWSVMVSRVVWRAATERARAVAGRSDRAPHARLVDSFIMNYYDEEADR